MPKDWRVAVLWGAVVVFAAWILWWASAGYPLDGPICLDEITKESCPRFNVIVYSLWRFARTGQPLGGVDRGDICRPSDTFCCAALAVHREAVENDRRHA